jgi:chemotaxis protein CheD
MYRHFNTHFQSDVTTIHPGEYHASAEDGIIATVLGSCVAVALYDPVHRFGGLNHFMLPGHLKDRERYYLTNAGKYGMFAMELLINEMLKMGTRRKDLIAKVFGGASVLNRQGTFSSTIPEDNIRFAQSFLETEGIPVVAQDVGGRIARKIFYFPTTSRVLLKRISGTLIRPVEQQEEQYLETIREKAEDQGAVTFFE